MAVEQSPFTPKEFNPIQVVKEPYIVERLGKLEDVEQRWLYLNALKRKDRIKIPFVDWDNQEKIYLLNPQVMFGIYCVRQSLYQDLAAVGVADLAEEVREGVTKLWQKD